MPPRGQRWNRHQPRSEFFNSGGLWDDPGDQVSAEDYAAVCLWALTAGGAPAPRAAIDALLPTDPQGLTVAPLLTDCFLWAFPGRLHDDRVAAMHYALATDVRDAVGLATGGVSPDILKISDAARAKQILAEIRAAEVDAGAILRANWDAVLAVGRSLQRRRCRRMTGPQLRAVLHRRWA